jgi:hypothetical protein
LRESPTKRLVEKVAKWFENQLGEAVDLRYMSGRILSVIIWLEETGYLLEDCELVIVQDSKWSERRSRSQADRAAHRVGRTSGRHATRGECVTSEYWFIVPHGGAAIMKRI